MTRQDANEQGLRLGTPVRGVIPRTGREITGLYQERLRNGQHLVYGERWDGDREHMPRHQHILDEVTPLEGEEAEDLMYETAARAILAGQSTREAEIAEIAKAKKIGKDKAGGRLDAAIAEQKAAQKAAAPKAKAKAAPRQPSQTSGRARLEQVPPSQFAELRDSLGLTNKQCAAASAEAGLGSTLSRMTELTASKGASVRIYDQVAAAWTSWAKAHSKEVSK